MARLVYAAIVAAALCGATSAARAQTTSAYGQSLEFSERGEELARAGEYARAAQVFRRAIEVDDGNARAHLGLSRALLALGRHDEALVALREAQAALGWRADLAIQRASHLARLQRWTDALDALARVEADDAQAHLADRVRATAHLGLEQWEEAVAALERYLARRPAALRSADASIRTRLAFALIHHGDYLRARRLLGEVLSETPRQLSARVLLFTALAKAGDCPSALRLYDDLQGALAAVPTLIYDAAVCQFRVGDAGRALALLDEHRAVRPLPDRALLLSARIYASQGDAARAEAAYRAAITAGLPVEVELARWWTRRGEHRAVAELLAPLAEAGSDDGELLYLAATALQRVDELDRAAAICARLAARSPELRSWLLEGSIQLQRGRWQAAEQAYLRAIASTEAPDERATTGLRQALEQRATLAFRAGDREAAHELLVRAHAADPNADRVAYDLALLELERGDAARAVALLDGRVARLASPARGHLVLGTALARTGDVNRARVELERAADSDTANAALRTQALAGLAALLARSAPARASEVIARARELGATDVVEAALARASATAQLALAESAYRRNDDRQLRAHLRRIETTAVPRAARPRLRVLQAYLTGRDKGLARALRQLASIPEAELAPADAGALPAAALRHALALELGARLIERPGDYARHLRAPASALRRFADDGSRVAGTLLTSWYARLLDWALARPAPTLARALARDAPPGARAPELEHNAIIAASMTARGHTPFSQGQIAQLERLAATVSIALVNLATDAEQRGDHARALAYLERIPASDRTPAIREWIRWKELLYGAP